MAWTLQDDSRDYTERIQARLQWAWKRAYETTTHKQEMGCDRHDKNKRTLELQVGDVVLPRRMRQMGPHMKLGDRFSIPHVVRKVKGGMLFLTPQHWDNALVLPIHQRNTKLLCRKAESQEPAPPPLPDDAPMVTPAVVDPTPRRGGVGE